MRRLNASPLMCLLEGFLFLLAGCARSGVPIDELRLKADQGDSQAQLQLAYAYDVGRGVARDQEQAAAWYRKSAEQGNPAAQNSLGSLYQNGEGVAPDDAEAVRWYRKSADQGYGEAFANLGYMYDRGLGVREDKEKAVSLYRQGAEKFNPTSMLNLGVSYWKGEGVRKDMVQAVMWVDLARFYTQRSSNMRLKWRIRAMLDEVREEATLEEIHKAGLMAQEWEEKHLRQ